MLCSRFLQPPSDRHNFLFRVTERMFDAWRDVYGWTLRGVLRYRFAMLVVAAATLVATVLPARTPAILMVSPVSSGRFFRRDGRVRCAMAKILAEDPNMAASGVTVNGGANNGRMQLRLKPRNERKLTADEIINELRPKMAQIPGGRAFMTNPPSLRIGGFSSRSQYVFTLQGQDLDELYHSAATFENVLKRIPGLTDGQQRSADRQPAGNARHRP